ncbi:MAG: polysaccharide biosynthesis/export family protein [Verrucomicrobiota bacterium]
MNEKRIIHAAMRKFFFAGFILAGLLSRVVGTLTASPSLFEDVPDSTTSASSNAPPVAAALLNTNVPMGTVANPSGYVPDDKYKLHIGDTISFQIIEDKDAPRSLVVTDSGELDVPYIGRAQAVGKTCKQLADELKVQLEKEYYYRATVIIALDSANKFCGRVYIWGEVRNPGPIDLSPDETLTAGKAIIRAGGFTEFAKETKVKIIRSAGAKNGGKQIFELNISEILDKGETEKDLALMPDDYIIVPSRLINF